MSKLEINLRHTAIINRLKKGPATLIEINQYLASASELMEYKLTVSGRTFQRDRYDILSMYNLEIECNKAKNEYYIIEKEDDTFSNRLLDALNNLHALNSSAGLQQYLEFEHFANSGAEHFHGLLHAVKNNFEVGIHYQSYWDEEPRIRNVRPYFLKEFRNRWYLIALDLQKTAIRTFALDRIIELDISRKRFGKATAVKAKSYFKNSFGIIGGAKDEILEPIVLCFTELQGRYIKSLPLHPDQKTLRDDEDGLLIQLNVYPTFDLEMQILSYGEHVKVISPERFKIAIQKRLNNTLSQYLF